MTGKGLNVSCGTFELFGEADVLIEGMLDSVRRALELPVGFECGQVQSEGSQ